MAVANAIPHTFDATLSAVSNSKSMATYLEKKTRNALKHLQHLERILIVSDTNIGDAVLLQIAPRVFRHHFPDCTIDYMYQKKAEPLIRHNPDIDNHIPLFTTRDFTDDRHNTGMEQIIAEHDYDLILNFYPFFSNGELKNATCPIITPFKLVTNIIRAAHKKRDNPHVTTQANLYLHDLINLFPDAVRPTTEPIPFTGSILYFSESTAEQMRDLCHLLGIGDEDTVAYINPDTSSKYTLMPFQTQVELIRELLSNERIDHVLLGMTYSFTDLQATLYEAIPHDLRHKLIKIPKKLSMDVCAALVDRADVFITGDTAQLHFAAAYKECESNPGVFRNRTPIINIFGATWSTIYGYDSFSGKHLPPKQDAPARAFEGHPPCKNLTCIHKTRKTCQVVRCFEGISLPPILEFVEELLSTTVKEEYDVISKA